MIKKMGFLKNWKILQIKKEELLNAFRGPNKVRKAAKNQSDYNCDNAFAFYEF